MIEPQVIEAPSARPPAFPPPGTRFDQNTASPIDGDAPAKRRSILSRTWLFVALCVVVFGAIATVYLASMTDNLSVEGDNAIYMILAKAMDLGHGYTNIQSPVPRIEAQYPPLFPLMLVPIVHVFGVGGVLQMQALVTGFALASLVMGFFMFRRWTTSGVLALAVMLATAESDLVWSFSHKILTEVPYLFLTLAACYLASRYSEQEHWRTWMGLATILAASAAFLTRTIGVSVCAAIPAYLLLAPPLRASPAVWKSRALKAAAVSAGIAIFAGGWTIRNRIVFSGQGHNYIGQFFLKQAYVPDAGSVSPNGLLQRMGVNATYYADQFQRTIGGHFWDPYSSRPEISHLLMAVAVAGFIFALVRRRTVGEFYTAGYVVIVLLWPWQDLRFAVPLMPFLFYYLAIVLGLPFVILSRLRHFSPQIATGAALCALSLPGGIHTLHTAEHDRSVGYHYQSDKLGEWEAYADWQDFHAAAMWLKDNAIPGSTVINRSPNIFYLWTGLASRNYPYTFDTWSVMQDVSHEEVDYVVMDDFTWTYTTGLYMKPTLNRFPDRFLLLHKFRGTTVYEVIPTPKVVPYAHRSGSR